MLLLYNILSINLFSFSYILIFTFWWNPRVQIFFGTTTSHMCCSQPYWNFQAQSILSFIPVKWSVVFASGISQRTYTLSCTIFVSIFSKDVFYNHTFHIFSTAIHKYYYQVLRDHFKKRDWNILIVNVLKLVCAKCVKMPCG